MPIQASESKVIQIPASEAKAFPYWWVSSFTQRTIVAPDGTYRVQADIELRQFRFLDEAQTKIEYAPIGMPSPTSPGQMSGMVRLSIQDAYAEARTDQNVANLISALVGGIAVYGNKKGLL